MHYLIRIICTMFPVVGVALGCAGEQAVNPNTEYQDEITPTITDISAEEAYSMILDRADDPEFHVIDVRTSSEYAGGYIDGAVNLDYTGGGFAAALDNLAKDDTYLLYCRSGGRSAGARNLMENAGFTSVYNMLGGITRWNELEYPVTMPE